MLTRIQTLLSPIEVGRELIGRPTRQRAKATSFIMYLEGLEERKLLSSVALDNGVLQLVGSQNDVNLISVTNAGNGRLTATVNEKNITVSSSQVRSIDITGGDQSDSIFISTGVTIGANINGLGGDDFIQGGGGNDVIHGGGGNDYINGRGGRNTLYTDGGNDTLVVTPATDSYTITGGQGKVVDSLNGSTLAYRSSAPAVTTTPAKPVVKPSTPAIGSQTTSTKPTGSVTVTTKPAAPAPVVTKPAVPTPPKAPATPPMLPTTPTTPTQSQTPTPSPTNPSGAGTNGGAVAPANGGTSTVAPTQNPSAPVQNHGGATPTANIRTLGDSVTEGGTIFVDGTNSTLGAGDPTTSNYQWDFGDPGSQYNQLQGFNAAHAYDRPGTYTITLRVTNELGNQSVTTQKVTITPDNRQSIYIAADGNDANSGLSPDAPIRTVGRAQQLLQDNTRLLFKAGQTFNFSTPQRLIIPQNNVLVGSYGSGARPNLVWTDNNPTGYASFIALEGNNDTVRGLSFNVPGAANTTDEGSAFAIVLAGNHETVRDNLFLNVGYAVNGAGRPDGVLVQDNNAPLETGLKGYFVWCEGSDYTIIGNTALNSTREHIVRMEFTQRMNVSYNNFTNLNRSTQGDPLDGLKGVVIVHDSTYQWIAHNTLADGQIQFGPLENIGMANVYRSDYGMTWAQERTTWTVFEGNTVNNTVVEVHTGADGISIRNNILHPPTDDWAVEVVGYNAEYKRDAEDVRILNNSVITNNDQGGMLKVTGPATRITLDNNLFVGPNYQTGENQSSLVCVAGTDLSSFAQISGNVWQTPSTPSYASGEFFYVWPTWVGVKGYLTEQEWDALPQVSDTEAFGDISLNAADAPITTIANNAKPVSGVFLDYYGKARPANSPWSAGAVQA